MNSKYISSKNKTGLLLITNSGWDVHPSFQLQYLINICNVCTKWLIVWLFYTGQLQCGFKCVQWMGRKPTGWIPCPNSPKWMSCDLKSWNSSRSSQRGRGFFTVASRWGSRVKILFKDVFNAVHDGDCVPVSSCLKVSQKFYHFKNSPFIVIKS